jgi:hypothetical protein
MRPLFRYIQQAYPNRNSHVRYSPGLITIR